MPPLSRENTRDRSHQHRLHFVSGDRRVLRRAVRRRRRVRETTRSRTATCTVGLPTATPASPSTSQQDENCQGRLIMPLEGAHAGHEDAFAGSMGAMLGGLPLVVRLGGYMVESNMGHIGDDIDPKGGDDPTLYGWRAAAEVARFSKHVAAQVYGAAPHHSYVWGGSGGGRRSPLCLENAPDAFDGALPFMGGGNIMPFPATEQSQEWSAHRVRVHVQRAATVASRRQARPTRRRHAAGRQREPIRRAEQPRTRRARVPLRAGIPVRRRAHDLLADGSDLAVDLDRRPPRRAGPDVLLQLLDRARVHRSRPAIGGGGRPHRRRHHGRAR